VLTTIDGFSLANKDKQRVGTDPAGPSSAFAGNATQVPATNLTKTAVLAASKEDIKTRTGIYAPSPIYSSARLKAMFAHPGFESVRNTSRLTLENRNTNRLSPDCPENAFLRRACEYFTVNTVTEWQLLQDSFDIVNFRDIMHKLRTSVLDKCPASTYHDKSAELSDAIKDMEL
jgi:hypothetical protein